MIRLLRYLVIAIVILVLAVATAWGALAIWYRLPVGEPARVVLSVSFGVYGLAVILTQFGRRGIPALVGYALVFAGLLAWWATIRPPDDGNWNPEVARQVTGRIDGDTLTLTNVREFQWQPDGGFTPTWTTREYDLKTLQSVDMYLSYWSGPEIAHFILSFGFAGDQYIAWSVEVRREVGSVYSPLADMFKSHTLIILAASEQDVVGVRSNVRGEDVQMFRLRTRPGQARALLEEYVRDANALAARPEWYNSLGTNCTTVVVRMMAAIGDRLPLDWRMVANGYLPDYAYEMKALDTALPLSELRELGRIAPRALAAGLGPAFSKAIRLGVPKP